MTRTIGWTALAMALVVPLHGTAQDKKVELKVAKFADIDKAVAAHKGKVVVVDHWALT